MKITDLSAHPKNPRKITEDETLTLQKTIDKFGDLGGIVYNVKTKRLNGGHQRINAFPPGSKIEIETKYKKPTRAGTVAEGYIIVSGEKFKYREVSWTEEFEEAAMLAANKAGGNWDNGKLVDVLKGLMGKIDMDLTGFSQKELEKLLPKPSEEGQCDEDFVPLPPKKPKSVQGDIYELGPHRLICGDALNLTHIEKLMGGGLADMVFTDPPYNVAYTGKTKEALTIQNDAMGDDNFYKFLFDAYANLLVATKPGGAIYVCHADSEGANFRLAMKNTGWLLKQCIIWMKNTIVMGRQDYHWKHEPILYGWKPGASHNWYNDRKQSTIFECNKPQRNGEHPTMKPVELVEYFIGNSSPRESIVLDVFGGSGSTLIACEKTKRRGFLCELDPIYCDVIVNRYVKFSGNANIKLNGKDITWKIKADA